jgi:hypothetical protein
MNNICADIDNSLSCILGCKINVKRKDNLFLLSSSTDKHHDNRRITISDRSILNEQDEHGEEGEEKRLEQGATFPPFFPLSFFFLFLFFFPPSPPFRGDLKVFHQHDMI